MTAAEKRELLEGASWNYYDKRQERLLKRQLAKHIWRLHGQYATVLYLYQSWEDKTGRWGHPRVAIVRYKWQRWMQGREKVLMWKPVRSISIGGEAGPYEMLRVISEWYGPDGAASRAIDEWQAQEGLGMRPPVRRCETPPEPGAHRMKQWRWRLQQRVQELEQWILDRLDWPHPDLGIAVSIEELAQESDIENGSEELTEDLHDRAFEKAVRNLLHRRQVWPTITHRLRRAKSRAKYWAAETGDVCPTNLYM